MLTRFGSLLGFWLVALLAPASAESQVWLAIYAAPHMIAHPDFGYPVVVQLQDAAGNPVFPTAKLTVTLSSSNPAVVRIYNVPTLTLTPPDPARSERGTTWANGQIVAARVDVFGNATISASAPGVAGASVTVSTVPRPREGWPKAQRLALTVMPPVVEVGKGPHALFAPLDAAGRPTGSGGVTRYVLQSSNTAVMQTSSMQETSTAYHGGHMTGGLMNTGAPGRTELTLVPQRTDLAGSTAWVTVVAPPKLQGVDVRQQPAIVTPRPPDAPLKEITVAAGMAWEAELPATRTLDLLARLEYPRAGGGNFALEISVNGRPVTSALLNKAANFQFADGRTFSYYDAGVPGWLLFYSPDFSGNDTPAAAGYQVLTDPGQAYRYQWNISALIGTAPTMRLRLYNRGGGPNVPIVLRLPQGVGALPPALPSGKGLRVVVQDEQGRQVPGTAVRVGAPPCAAEATTDAGGVAVLRMPPGCP